MYGYRSAGHDRFLPTLNNCDREPIHIPGMIQPHGVLFGISHDTLRISAVSENVGLYGHLAASQLIQTSIAQSIDPQSFIAINGRTGLSDGETCRLTHVTLFGAPDTVWRASLHRNAAGLLLEAEPLRDSHNETALEYLDRFQSATMRLQAAVNVAEICERLAEEVRRLTDYDRVMVYRFTSDWNGEVIAEDANAMMPSYLGLHFPASDIPVQARALYVTNLERQIPDIGYQGVNLLTSHPGSLDLSQVGVRSVSPIHITYLQNMGVGASMSISLLHQGRLWGLVACHHHVAHYVSPELRQASVLLAQLAAVRLSLIEQAQVARRNIAVKAIETRLLHEAADGHDYHSALLRNSRLLLDLLDATGMALASGGTITTLGETPPTTALEPLLAWLSEGEPELLATDHLAGHYPAAAGWVEAAGILAVPLGGVPQNLLVWFRPEIARTVTWAGNPTKPLVNIDGEDRLTPRASFAKWTEAVSGRCRPWSSDEITAANGLRDTIVEIIVRRSLLLEQMNTQLARSNEELEAFAYVASHDLKEPLRQIETFGTLLQRAFSRQTDPAEKIERWFAGIHNSSRRLRQLINDLAEYSRLGGQARPFEPVDFGILLAAILRDFDGRIEELGAKIEVSPLPVLMCDGIQMRQVLQNLIANALKYRHPDRAPVVRISADAQSNARVQRQQGLPVITLRVEDNGIGFDERHRERIFEPFERLHSSDKYEGTGLGLAICRKVVDRHGGTITAHGQPGAGAVFIITLPLRPHPEQKTSIA